MACGGGQELCFVNAALKQGAAAYLEPQGELEVQLRRAIATNLQTLGTACPPSPQARHQVYHGQGGLGLLHLRLFQAATDDRQRQAHLDAAHQYASAAWQKCREKLEGEDEVDRISSFLCGQAGVMALCAVVAHYRQQADLRTEMVERLLDCLDDPECELLYGRSGYVYCLAFIDANIGRSLLPARWSDIARRVVQSIVASGRDYSRSRRHESPLMYKWYHSEYLGAAHGLAGILYTLLFYPEFLSTGDMRDVRASAEYLLRLMQHEGNLPMCHGDSNRVHLVQWCHGAPGVVGLFCRLHELTRDDKWLVEAKRAAELVWRAGLLKKSISLCHGAVGNAYAFLSLYRYTRDEEYLRRASVFMLWSVASPEAANMREPDSPHSLFEGMAGTTYAYVEVLHDPLVSSFPAFDPPQPFASRV